MTTAENVYCYHCGRHHPRKEMRQIETKSGKKWRCIQSTEATKKNRTQRDAFGKTVTAINTSENQARIKSRLHAERLVTGQLVSAGLEGMLLRPQRKPQAYCSAR